MLVVFLVLIFHLQIVMFAIISTLLTRPKILQNKRPSKDGVCVEWGVKLGKRPDKMLNVKKDLRPVEEGIEPGVDCLSELPADKESGCVISEDWLFDAIDDAATLRNCLVGTPDAIDKQILIKTLCCRSSQHRDKIADAYESIYHTSLILDLKENLKPYLASILEPLLYDRWTMFARHIQSALVRGKPNLEAVVEVLCTLDNSGLRNVKMSYAKHFGSSLENDIRRHSTGYLRKICVHLAKGLRDEEGIPDKLLAKFDAQMLFNNGPRQWVAADSFFNNILLERSYEHLREVCIAYKDITGRVIEDDVIHAVDSGYSGDQMTAQLMILRRAQSLPRFLAYRLGEALNKSKKSFGIEEDTLIRIISSNAGEDLTKITSAFEEVYGDSLNNWIKDGFVGCYRDALLALITDSTEDCSSHPSQSDLPSLASSSTELSESDSYSLTSSLSICDFSHDYYQLTVVDM